MIGLVAATASGRAAAAELASAWPDAEVFPGPVADALREAWRTGDGIVSFLAVGATVRVLAPLLRDKRTEPGVVCVDEARRFAVAVLGGHHGANALAERTAQALGATAVITTGSDVAGTNALDRLGLPAEGDLAGVGAALLSGEPVTVTMDPVWPLPPLPARPGPGARTIVVSDRADVAGDVVLRPPSLVVGIGSARGVSAGEVAGLFDEALAEYSPLSVRCVATVDLKAGEPGILDAAAQRGWEVVTYPARELDAIAVPNPSEIVRAEVGTASVAEAAALLAAGPDASLVVEKRRSAGATVAVARVRVRGRLCLIGLGPGARDLLTPRAITELQSSSVVVGLDQYVDQVRDLLRPGTQVLSSPLGREEDRARTAVSLAVSGRAVALVGSGDTGIYAMASPALEVAGDDIDVVGVPGITAALASASLLGAPLGHDHAYISLSDLNTPWDAIERRVLASAEGDFTVCFYNPRSRQRTWQLPKALEILAAHRPPETPVGVVRNASRPDERASLTTLAAVDPADVDMYSLVVVGSSRSRIIAGRFVTPRGYRWT